MTNLNILLGLGAYLLVMLGVGVYASRRISGTEDFIVAGKRLGMILGTATLAATWFGGGLCIGAASAAYSGGMRAVIADPFGAALCLFLAGLLYVRVLRRMGLMTVASFFTSRFDGHCGLAASLCTIPAYVGWVAALMVAFGRILQSLIHIDPAVGICIGGAVVLIYTFAGGMWAVTLTDFIQLVILVGGMVVITPILLNEMGGWDNLAAQIPSERFDFYPHEGGATAWFAYARDWLVIGLGNLAGQDLIQRSLSCRDERVAYRSAYAAGIIYLTVGLLPVLLGMAGAIILPDLAEPDLIMMELAMRYLPTVTLIFFTGALVSALLSSADSALLAPASVIGWDLLRYIWPGAGERLCLRVSRTAVVALGLASVALALHRTAVYELMVDSWSVLLATLFVPLTAGIWWRRANAPGALAAVVSGLVAWLVLMQVTPHLPADLLAVPFAAVALVAASLLTQHRSPPQALVGAHGEPIHRRDRLGW